MYIYIYIQIDRCVYPPSVRPIRTLECNIPELCSLLLPSSASRARGLLDNPTYNI